MTPTVDMLKRQLAAADLKALAHYTDGDLLNCIVKILSHPGPMTKQDIEDWAVVNEVFRQREYLHAILDLHKPQQPAQMN